MRPAAAEWWCGHVPSRSTLLFEALGCGTATELSASVSVRDGRGVLGPLRRAAEAVLASGAAVAALVRFPREAASRE